MNNPAAELYIASASVRSSHPLPINKICVIGFPSKLGGADTELDHQITLWREMGLEVHLIHTGGFDRNGQLMKQSVEGRGCVVHRSGDWSAAAGMHVISYCNGDFLKHLPEIRRFAKTTTFVGCMTWAFDKQKAAHRKGLIDLELFQTEHQREMVSSQLSRLRRDFQWAMTVPYWNQEAFPFIDPTSRKTDRFYFGRISRDDADKFAKRQLWVYETMVAPVKKYGVMLGFSQRSRQKIGTPPPWIKTYACGGLSQQDFYRTASCVIQMSDTHENLPRVGFEAMSSGSVLIVDDRGGWRELIKHGETGFLCKDERDFVYYASRMAYEPEERHQIARNARDWLDRRWSREVSKRSWENIFRKLSTL